jgi:hypothetical protein
MTNEEIGFDVFVTANSRFVCKQASSLELANQMGIKCIV